MQLLREENIVSLSDAFSNVCRCGKLVTVARVYAKRKKEEKEEERKTHAWGKTSRGESVKKYIRHVKGIYSVGALLAGCHERRSILEYVCTRTYTYDVGFKRYIENITVLSHGKRSRANFTSLARKSSPIVCWFERLNCIQIKCFKYLSTYIPRLRNMRVFVKCLNVERECSRDEFYRLF